MPSIFTGLLKQTPQVRFVSRRTKSLGCRGTSRQPIFYILYALGFLSLTAKECRNVEIVSRHFMDLTDIARNLVDDLVNVPGNLLHHIRMLRLRHGGLLRS